MIGDRAIATLRHLRTTPGSADGRWAAEPMSRFWSRLRLNCRISRAFSAKTPVDCRLFLQKGCRPGTKARPIIGHFVVRPCVFMHIPGGSFIFNIFWAAVPPELLLALCLDPYAVASPRLATVQRRIVCSPSPPLDV